MNRQKELSGFNLLRGVATFKDNDPHWYKLLLFIFFAVFLLVLAWILKGWFFPIAGAGVRASKLEKIIALFSNKSP